MRIDYNENKFTTQILQCTTKKSRDFALPENKTDNWTHWLHHF